MIQHDVMVFPKLYKRVVALLVDIIVCIQFFNFFQMIINPIFDSLFHYQDVLVEYHDKMVEHGLGYYDINDETEVKIYIDYEIGEKISQEEFNEALEKFKNDSRAMEVLNKVNTLSMIGTAVTLFLAIIPNYLLFPLIFKNGQTLGKKLMKIAIVDKDGCRVKFSSLILRNIVGLYLFDLLVSYFFMLIINIPIIAIISLLMGLFTKNKRTVHDLVANTYVVDEELSIIYFSLEDKEAFESK